MIASHENGDAKIIYIMHIGFKKTTELRYIKMN